MIQFQGSDCLSLKNPFASSHKEQLEQWPGAIRISGGAVVVLPNEYAWAESLR
ncbi:MAG: hypothetical protein JRC77_10430 [Deltaproteobacteria bacterium]|nr:hypothetical protein [Deltaproteobacteria bacterium]